MTESKSNASASINFGWLGLLGVLLVAAKIADSMGYNNLVGDWSWWLVLLPFYGGLVVLMAFFALAGLVVLVNEATKSRRYRKRRAKQKAEAEALRNRRLGH